MDGLRRLSRGRGRSDPFGGAGRRAADLGRRHPAALFDRSTATAVSLPQEEQGYEFLGDLLAGDDIKGTAEQLSHVEEQLTSITDQLDSIHEDLQSIQGQLVGQELRGRLTALDNDNINTRAVYDNDFLPIVAAAKQVNADKATIANGGQANLDASKAQLAQKKQAFDTDFSTYQIFGTLLRQHNALYPENPDGFSVLKLAGQSMESKGYFTSMDSERLHNLYLGYADQEALTATLILEPDRVFNGDTASHAKQYQDFHAIEEASLATPVPHGQIKVGAQLYMVPEGDDGAVRTSWLPRSPSQGQLGGNDPALIATAHAGWSLPTDPQLNALYIGTLKAPQPTDVPDSGSGRLCYMWKQGGDPDADRLGKLWQQQ